MSDIVTEAERYLEIDWSKEPASAREERIRAALLERQLVDVERSPGYARILLTRVLGYRTTELASDARAALELADMACVQKARVDKLREIEEAIREADRDGA